MSNMSQPGKRKINAYRGENRTLDLGVTTVLHKNYETTHQTIILFTLPYQNNCDWVELLLQNALSNFQHCLEGLMRI